MKYEIRITACAKSDLERAAEYIESVLKSPKSANDLLDEAGSRIGSLAVFPEKYRQADDPVLSFWGIRCIAISNYLAFYTIDHHQHLVIVVRVLCQKSNWSSTLRREFPMK